MCASRRVLFRFAVALGLGVGLAAPGASALSCKEDVVWEHVHVEIKGSPQVTDVKGSRATLLEVCRTDDGASVKGLIAEVRFEGSHGERELVVGECTKKFAKWAVVRSASTKEGPGTGTIAGLYRICRE